MLWKIRSLAIALLLPLSIGPSVADYSPSKDELAAIRQKYTQPTAIPYPDEDAYSLAKADLGHKLFFDPLLSGSRTHACASCHNPALSWQDGLPLAVGDGQNTMPLRTPSLLDAAWLDRYGWTGKFPDLETVVFAPIVTKGNMDLAETALIARLAAEPDYVRDFAAAFPDHAIDRTNIEQALATFVRSIVSPQAPFDRWIMGDETAISPAAKRGFGIFNGKGRCAECHSGWAFTDGSYHDIGVAKDDDIGRGQFFPTSVKLRHAFKTPTLRDVAQRAPYMHNGSLATLEAVIDLYNRGGIARPSRAEKIKPLGLTALEKADLIAFIKTLTSDRQVASFPTAMR